MTDAAAISSTSDPRSLFSGLIDEMLGLVVGQDRAVRHLVTAFLAEGHVLLEGAPGLAKTRLARLLTGAIEGTFKRIQFTPDLLPSDLVGSALYLAAEGKFTFQPGPVFANFILADEINRAPAKVQSALLEAMEERQVTVAGKTYPLPPLFMVLATQNPIEQEGTYPLPEAQMDRFLMKISVDYPDTEAELAIVRLLQAEEADEQEDLSQISQDHIFAARDVIGAMKIAHPVEQYIVDLVMATRQPGEVSEQLAHWIDTGSSPRATDSVAIR